MMMMINLKEPQYLTLISETSVDAHLLNLWHKDLLFSVNISVIVIVISVISVIGFVIVVIDNNSQLVAQEPVI